MKAAPFAAATSETRARGCYVQTPCVAWASRPRIRDGGFRVRGLAISYQLSPNGRARSGRTNSGPTSEWCVKGRTCTLARDVKVQRLSVTLRLPQGRFKRCHRNLNCDMCGIILTLDGDSVCVQCFGSSLR